MWMSRKAYLAVPVFPDPRLPEEDDPLDDPVDDEPPLLLPPLLFFKWSASDPPIFSNHGASTGVTSIFASRLEIASLGFCIDRDELVEDAASKSVTDDKILMIIAMSQYRCKQGDSAI